MSTFSVVYKRITYLFHEIEEIGPFEMKIKVSITRYVRDIAETKQQTYTLKLEHWPHENCDDCKFKIICKNALPDKNASNKLVYAAYNYTFGSECRDEKVKELFEGIEVTPCSLE